MTRRGCRIALAVALALGAVDPALAGPKDRFGRFDTTGPLGAAYAPLRAYVAAKNIDPDTLVGGTVFTTEAVEDPLFKLRQAVRAAPTTLPVVPTSALASLPEEQRAAARTAQAAVAAGDLSRAISVLRSSFAIPAGIGRR